MKLTEITKITRITETLEAKVWPHRAAQRLLDRAYDERSSGGGEVGPEDKATEWLASHLRQCPACSTYRAVLFGIEDDLRRFGGEPVPEGFEDRVLHRLRSGISPKALDGSRADANSRLQSPVFGALGASREAKSSSARRRPRSMTLGLAFASAGSIALFVLVLVGRGPSDRSEFGQEALHIGGSAATRAVALPPATDFTVRALGIGAAKARVQIAEVVRDASATMTDEANAILVVVPRNQLMNLLEGLARQGPYQVTKNPHRTLSTAEVSLRFEIE